MFGIAIGIICTILFFKVAFGRRRWHRHHRGRGWFMRRALYRLNTGPGQEKVLLGEMNTLRETFRGMRGELKEARKEIAALLRDETFDQTKVDALFRKQDELIGRARAAVAASVEKVHGVLDASQKEQLAAMLEGGFHYGYGC